MTPEAELGQLLAPAAGGLYLVSTGRAEQLELQRRIYRASSEAEVRARFEQTLERIREAKVVLLGIPSDTGAGFQRGANLGPWALRKALHDANPDFAERGEARGLFDLGDVRVVPQLLHDEMLGEAQKAASRRALYGAAADPSLPVSPLSIAERALDLVFRLNPQARPLVIGGDHSTAWPVVAALARARSQPFGIVQPDAHTDLLEERLGVRYCFATWSFHANVLIGKQGRLVQVGTRASRHDRAHWERTQDVRQFWAEECRARPEATLDAILAHVAATGVAGVYFSNDIDGTDSAYADATGTPEPGGLEPDFVVELIRRLAQKPGLVGGDVMELAPPLQPRPDSTARTVALAARYLRETAEGLLGARL